MSLPAFATIADLAARGVDLDVDDAEAPATVAAQAALDDGASLIRDEAGGKTWVTGDALDSDAPDILRTINLNSARRALANPDQVEEQSLGSFSEKPVQPWLTKAEKRSIRRAAGRTGLAVLPTTRGVLETETVPCAYPDGRPAGSMPWSSDPYQP